MNTKFVATLALAVAGSAVFSSAARADGFFIDGRAGRSSFDNGNDTALGINGGYRWGAFGLEGGYTDLGKSDPFLGGGSGANEGIDLKGWTAGVNGHFNLTPNWYLSARGGLFHWKADMDLAGSSHNASFSGNSWYGGVGAGYDFSERFGVGINYDIYRARKGSMDFDAKTVSVNTEFRF